MAFQAFHVILLEMIWLLWSRFYSPDLSTSICYGSCRDDRNPLLRRTRTNVATMMQWWTCSMMQNQWCIVMSTWHCSGILTGLHNKRRHTTGGCYCGDNLGSINRAAAVKCMWVKTEKYVPQITYQTVGLHPILFLGKWEVSKKERIFGRDYMYVRPVWFLQYSTENVSWKGSRKASTGHQIIIIIHFCWACSVSTYSHVFLIATWLL